METVEAEIVYTRDRSNGRVHERYRIAGNPILSTREGCNIDQAGAYDEISKEDVEATNPVLLCGNDFPVVVDADDGTVEPDPED